VVLEGVVVSVSFTSPGRLSSRADCCWACGGRVGEVVLSVWKRRREEGGLIGVDGRRGRRREDQQDERRPRGARRAASINFLYRPLPPDDAKLKLRRDCGVVLPHSHTTAQPRDFRGVKLIIKPRHTIRQPLHCRVLCSVPRTGITCANGHARVPARTHARRKDADCPPVAMPVAFVYPQTHPTVAHGHDTSSPPQWHALCGLRSTSPHPSSTLHCIEKSTPHPSARTGTAQGGRVRPRLHPNSLLQLCLDDSITRRPDSQSATELSADRRPGRITVQSSRGGEVEVKSHDQVF
jgi:hypothetical protein